MVDSARTAAERRSRPAVTVVVPFRGDRSAGERLVQALAVLRRDAGDQIVIADRSDDGALAKLVPADMEVVAAPDDGSSSYYARNIGAERAGNDWLLFLDADCTPAPDLLDRYFAVPPDRDEGAIGGEVRTSGSHTGLPARYAASRGLVGQATGRRHPYRPSAVAANLLVRREVWSSLGGFHEGIRSAGDGDFTWRLQEAGWTLAFRPDAWVEQEDRERLHDLWRQAAGQGAGASWLNRRYPGSSPPPQLMRGLARSAAGVVASTVTGRFEQARFRAIDALVLCATAWGYLRGNRAGPARPAGADAPAAGPALTVMTDTFPARSETFVYNELRELRALGWSLSIEAGARPARPERSVARELPARFVEDETILEMVRDLCWLAIRHPLRVGRDLVARRRWAQEERPLPLRALAPSACRLARADTTRLHVHFAGGAALSALRICNILGTAYSVTAHAYELFQRPANLREKLQRASFVVGECEYTADYMRGLVAPEQRGRVHRIATGVNPDRIRRRRPYPGGRTAVAIGRLIEKKGFPHLVAAAGLLSELDALDRLVIAGDGPLREALEEQVRALGLEHLVELRGNVWGAGSVSDLLETADVLVIPSVIAPDGDRDALPVVSYEALAMEVPVIASDLVGLPEVVKPAWGRLVEPGDSRGLAEALREFFALPPDERAEMGRAGRAFVQEDRDARCETERLSELLLATTRGAGSDPRARRTLAQR